MIIRIISIGWIALVSLAWAAPAPGQHLETFRRNVVRDWRRNNCWPKPFGYADRLAARAPFATMVSNGWQRQNLLDKHHFKDDNAALTEAGRLKVQWILTEAPRRHRTVYVHRAGTAEQTALRVEAIQELAAHLLPEGEAAAIVETGITFRGWPAERVDAISRKFQESAPSPRLSAAQPGGTN